MVSFIIVTPSRINRKTVGSLSLMYIQLSGNICNFFTRCLDYCTESGYLYAGVQYGVECFCGNERPSVNSDVDASKCNKFCPGDSDAKCGGYLTMNVYQTGVIPFKSEPARDDEVSKAEALRNPVQIVYLVCAVYNCFSLLPFSLHTNIKAIFLKNAFS